VAEGTGGTFGASGGATSSGGVSSGGAATGGATTGGATSGGASSGGAASGGGLSVGGSGGTTQTGGQPSGGGDGLGGGPPAGGNNAGGGDGSGGAVSGGGPGSGGAPGTGGGTSVKVCTVPQSLEVAGECNDKLVGAALASGLLNQGAYSTAAREHNYATPENEMKWDTVEGSSGNFNFGPGDQIVNFAQQNGMTVKGHTLVWHSQLPGWVNNLGSEAAVRSAMLNHIQKVMEHYRGKVVAWDVVNEAIDVDVKSTGNGNARYRNSVFYQRLGEGYIDEAFIKAREVDPNVKLFYNEFGADGMNDKADFMYEMVKGMLERGVPIDGVGLQMHIGRPNPSPTAAEVKENIKRLTELGLEVQISELDINGCDGFSDSEMAELYHGIVAACVAYPLCTAVTMWGISDQNSWVNTFSEAGCNGQSARALLWDNNYQKKASYNSVVRALTGN
jgi:endo-1,4-beta-xylanase